MKQELEKIADEILRQNANQHGVPYNFSNRDFMNTVIIFQTALVDKMYSLQSHENMELQDRLNMANCCGSELRKLIHTFTGLDTHNVEDFL